MAIEFYNVKKKKKVSIDESDIEKKTYERETKAGKKQNARMFAQTSLSAYKTSNLTDKVRFYEFIDCV